MKRFITLLIWVLFALSLQAKVVLPGLISDNMVLQRNADVTFWGEAAPGVQVRIAVSWNDAPVYAMADAEGNWKVAVQTPDAGGPYDVLLDDGEPVTIKNVMIGDVWLCSGQSNMSMMMRGNRSQPVEHALETIVDAEASQPIRICTVERAVATEELKYCKADWQENTSEAVSKCSAVAYYFAKRLQEKLDIPIGIIIAAKGGSRIESWMSRSDVQPFVDEFGLVMPDPKLDTDNPHHYPTMLYNAVLAPIKNYMIKGVIWYQGCGNVGKAALYEKIQPAFVKMLRRMWNNENLPFYYVQIAPYAYDDPDGIEAALLREAQLKGMKNVPHSGMVVTMDCGDEFCIHPAKKKPVGERLAYLALERSYGIKGFEAVAPQYESYEIKDGKAHVKFERSKLGVGPRGHSLTGFEVAGEDKVFHPAEAIVQKDHNEVVVWSEKVNEPVAVRYAFRNCSPVSLYNVYGIPVSPFRTDDWDR